MNIILDSILFKYTPLDTTHPHQYTHDNDDEYSVAKFKPNFRQTQIDRMEWI